MCDFNLPSVLYSTSQLHFTSTSDSTTPWTSSSFLGAPLMKLLPYWNRVEILLLCWVSTLFPRQKLYKIGLYLFFCFGCLLVIHIVKTYTFLTLHSKIFILLIRFLDTLYRRSIQILTYCSTLSVALASDTLSSIGHALSVKVQDALFETFNFCKSYNTRGGTHHMLRHTGMCCPNGLLFHQKSLDMGPILVKQILRGGSHFTKNWKNCKISRFWGRKTLRNGSQLAKIWHG